MADEEAATAESNLNSRPVPTPLPDHASVRTQLPSLPDGASQWLPEVLATMPMTSGSTPEETRLARYYNAEHVLSKIQAALANSLRQATLSPKQSSQPPWRASGIEPGGKRPRSAAGSVLSCWP